MTEDRGMEARSRGTAEEDLGMVRPPLYEVHELYVCGICFEIVHAKFTNVYTLVLFGVAGFFLGGGGKLYPGFLLG